MNFCFSVFNQVFYLHRDSQLISTLTFFPTIITDGNWERNKYKLAIHHPSFLSFFPSNASSQQFH